MSSGVAVRLASVDFVAASESHICRLLGRRVAGSDRQVVVGFVNPHVVVQAEGDAEVRRFLNRCDAVCIDGVGASVVLRLAGHRVQRVPAHRLLDDLLDNDLLSGSALIFGIEAEHLDAAIAALQDRAPARQVIGQMHGFASDSEIADAMLAHDRVDVVLIGAGSPRSEWIANRAVEAQPNAMIFSCGAGSLLALAGRRRNAPDILNRIGLDWAYRFVFEPHTRRRYTVGTVAYLRALLRPKYRGQTTITPQTGVVQ